MDLSNTGISDAGLMHVARLENLEDLDLSSTAVDGRGLIGATFKNLVHLDLSRTRVTDAILLDLASLPSLTELSLVRADVTTEGIQRFSARAPAVDIETWETFIRNR